MACSQQLGSLLDRETQGCGGDRATAGRFRRSCEGVGRVLNSRFPALSLMTISLEGRVRCRMEAPFHVQFQLENPAEISEGLSRIVVQGMVVRVFRAIGELGPGDHVGFEIWVCRPGDEPTGSAFIYCDLLKQARYAEAFLCGKPPHCSLAGYELAVIDTPTDEPTLTVKQLEELIVSTSTPVTGHPTPKKWLQRIFRNPVDGFRD